MQSTTNLPQASFTKLPDGDWGLKVNGVVAVDDEVFGVTRKGRSEVLTVSEVVSRIDGGVLVKFARKPKQEEVTEQPVVEEPVVIPSTGRVTVTEQGVYETPDGTVYVVKPNKAKTRLYAKRLVEINAQRATEAGERVRIEFEYERGAIFKITPDMKMPIERAKELTIRYGRCIVCGLKLKAAKSVEAGIGPVCRKSFR